MSGFVCILNLDGMSIDTTLLAKMTHSMNGRGPDGGGVWQNDTVGMGHRLLRTTFDTPPEKQPYSLDGNTWIVADARIDDRQRLRRELILNNQFVAGEATDDTLILHAYAVWGERCIHHLLGDFSFVIWDSHNQKLFCARDHWGTRLLFYAHVGNTFIVSNDLNCIRLHPLVTNRLNDEAIADFLLFDYNLNPSTTTFADIQRLAPAHTLTVTSEGIQSQQYWTLSIDRQIRYRQHNDYIEHFKELLDQAVSDRLRNPQIAILMSGGLDSTTITVAAKKLMTSQFSQYDLRGYTYVYDWLIPDDERHFAQLAAEAIKIPIQFVTIDNEPLFYDPNVPSITVPEPFHWPIIFYTQDVLNEIAQQGRVVLYGEDGDALLSPTTAVQMLKVQGLLRTIQDIGSFMHRYHVRPSLGLGVLQKIQAIKGQTPRSASVGVYPDWLNPDFEKRLDLPDLWQNYDPRPTVPPKFPRPRAYLGLMTPYMHQFWESLDYGVTRQPVEYRLPLFDMRVATYLLSIPTLPWCHRKTLLREAGQGVLPNEVLRRPKTPLAVDPVEVLVERSRSTHTEFPDPALRLLEYVRPEHLGSFPMIKGDPYNEHLYAFLRPMRLSLWLKSL